MNVISTQIHNTVLGELLLGEFDGKLCLLDYLHRPKRQSIDGRVQRILNASYCEQETALLKFAKEQICEYLSGCRRTFDVPLLMTGTDF